jgi:hypothetical protein
MRQCTRRATGDRWRTERKSRRSSLHERQHGGSDRSQGANGGLQHDPTNLGAGWQSRELGFYKGTGIISGERQRRQLYPDPIGSIRLARLGGKSIFVGGNVCHGLTRASWRQKLTAWPVLVYSAIPNVDRDAERMSKLACSAG